MPLPKDDENKSKNPLTYDITYRSLESKSHSLGSKLGPLNAFAMMNRWMNMFFSLLSGTNFAKILLKFFGELTELIVAVALIKQQCEAIMLVLAQRIRKKVICPLKKKQRFNLFFAQFPGEKVSTHQKF